MGGNKTYLPDYTIVGVVVTGDFNFLKGSDVYSKLVTGDFSDVSAVAETADSGCTYHNYSGDTKGEPIDFILVNEKVRDVLTYKIMREQYNGRYPSDHYPIYADLIF